MRVQQRDVSQHGAALTAVSRPLPAATPLTSALSRAFTDALQLQRCEACGTFIYYPRVVCPECLSDSLDWHDISGLGELLSFGVIWRPLHPAFNELVPLHLCTVRLVEGPIVLALLDSGAAEPLVIGTSVRLLGAEIGPGVRVPQFIPVSADVDKR
jgi:uncharacterized protein